MTTTSLVAALAVAAAGTALAVLAGEGATASCAGQVAGAPAPPGFPANFKGQFNHFFATLEPGWGQAVSAYAQAEQSACPPLPGS